MRSIEISFDYIKECNPYWSTWTCFTVTIRGKRFSRDRIRRYFNLLVDEDEYPKNEKRGLLKHLYELSNDTP